MGRVEYGSARSLLCVLHSFHGLSSPRSLFLCAFSLYICGDFFHDDLIFRFCVYRSKEFVLEPTKLTDFKGMTVIRISCGAHHSIAIVEDKSTGIDKVPFPSLPPLATAAVVDDWKWIHLDSSTFLLFCRWSHLVAMSTVNSASVVPLLPLPSLLLFLLLLPLRTPPPPSNLTMAMVTRPRAPRSRRRSPRLPCWLRRPSLSPTTSWMLPMWYLTLFWDISMIMFISSYIYWWF